MFLSDPHHKEKIVMFFKIVIDTLMREYTYIRVIKIYLHYSFEVIEQSYYRLKELI